MKWGMAVGEVPFYLFEDMIVFFLVADSVFTVGKDAKFTTYKIINILMFTMAMQDK